MSSYRSEFQRSIQHPEAFWAEQAERLPWVAPPTRILEYDEQGHARWYADGELNLCHAALDHHIEQGRGEQAALLWDSPVSGGKLRLSYAELRDRVARFAGALRDLGVEQGDRVVIYLPMVPEAPIAMLACARLGAVHSVVFGGFAPHELAVRIEDAEPKVVVAASCGIEVDRVLPYPPIVRAALEQSAHRPEACVILQREQCLAELGEDEHDWATLEAAAAPADCVPVKATDPLYVLYTSGTTGKPKGVVRDTGGYGVALHYSMEAVYDMAPGEVFFSASDVGWVVGHSYIVYGPLLRGCTTVVYEGKPVRTPDAEGDAGRAGGRPLVADRNRLAHRRQSAGGGADAGQGGLGHGAGAGLRRTHPRSQRPRRAVAGAGQRDDQAAVAAGLPVRYLARSRALPGGLHGGLSGLLPDRRRGLSRRGRLPVHHGAHR
ncbi:hypothetical protein HHA04nite_14760 [Halomonas halophila]|uniref:AMP-dependent synthetase/ligase domain-containing protein n=1 Tax=Halomonas halophila TaxID=29573 RepID=A0ABQ0U3E7_9GAMM|nr:hypothetical protein HHA04nite_14760 [Halomonas halophila]